MGAEVTIELTNQVAPYAGAWIEIVKNELIVLDAIVAPYAGAWIEIMNCSSWLFLTASLPAWERGLKWTLGNG